MDYINAWLGFVIENPWVAGVGAGVAIICAAYYCTRTGDDFCE